MFNCLKPGFSRIKSLLSRPMKSSFDYSKWEVLYKCRSVLTGVTGDNNVNVLLDCARAARRSCEFYPATRFLRQGKNQDHDNNIILFIIVGLFLFIVGFCEL